MGRSYSDFTRAINTPVIPLPVPGDTDEPKDQPVLVFGRQHARLARLASVEGRSIRKQLDRILEKALSEEGV